MSVTLADTAIRSRECALGFPRQGKHDPYDIAQRSCLRLVWKIKPMMRISTDSR